MISEITPDLIQRVFARTQVNGDCWEWTGATRAGYGAIKINGVVVSCHRLVHEMFLGEIPDGRLVIHSCDNRLCINPCHLDIGCHSENLHDAYDRDRRDATVGGRHGRAVLTDDIVGTIFRLRSENGWGKRRIATHLGLNPSTVGSVIRGLAWKHLNTSAGERSNRPIGSPDYVNMTG